LESGWERKREVTERKGERETAWASIEGERQRKKEWIENVGGRRSIGGWVLQCVVVCCSELQCGVVCCSVLHCVAVCRSVWQCVAVRGSAWQCVAVCCSVLQCVAVVDSAFVGCVFSWLVVRSYEQITMVMCEKNYRSLLQNIVSFIGLFCKRDI